MVVCDPKKLNERGSKGAPDLVIEFFSPCTAVKDMKIKRDLYERVGVKEYCAIGPTIDAGQCRIIKRVILAGAFAETGRHPCM